MSYSKMIEFDASKYRQRLDNLGIKLGELSKPTSIYYTGYTHSTVYKAFKTKKISSILLQKIDWIIEYSSNPDKKKPTIVNIVSADIIIEDLKHQNAFLQRKLDNKDTEAMSEVESLKQELRHLAIDLKKYSDSFDKASRYLKYKYTQ